MLSLVLAGVLAVEATAPPVVPVRTEQEQLQADIDAINTRLRLLDTNWPLPSAVSLYVGIGLTGTGLLGEGMLLLTSVVIGIGSRGRSLPVGLHVGMLVVAGVGLVLSAIGIVTGVRAAGPAREERDRLTEDRRRLEDALRATKRQPPMQLELPPVNGLLEYAGTF